MLRKLLIALALVSLGALLVTACGGTDSNSNSNSSNANNGNKPATTSSPGAASPASQSSPASTSSSSGEKIGVAECDAFLDRYEACVMGKVPESSRAQYRTSLEQWRKSWKDLASNPATKGTLAQACTMAHDQAKASMKSYGCDF